MSAMTEPPIEVAVIGVGRMGAHHARIYNELDQATLVAVVDGNTERCETMADRYGVQPYPDVNALLAAHPNLRAVTVATPTEAHETVATTLIDRKIACLIEKPLAGSSAEARRIVAAAKAADVVVQVGHSERFNPVVRALSDLDITPRFIEIDRVSPMQFRSVDVGVVFDIMIHDLDIVLMLAGSAPTDVRATGVAVLGDHEDVANARLEFSDGCVANLTASRLAMKTERKLRMFSETSYVSINYAKKEGVIIQLKDNAKALSDVRTQLAAGADLSDVNYADLVNVQEIAISDEEPLKAEQLNFLAAVEGREKSAVDAAAGCAAVEAAERVVESLRQHQWAGVDSSKPI
jgi:predicted dehydrogenase